MPNQSAKNRAITQFRDDCRVIFATPEGERVLRRLMFTFHMGTSTFNPDQNAMSYSEGQRSVVLHLLGQLQREIEPTHLNQELYHATRESLE